MKKRKLRDIEVSEIGMGCMGQTHSYGIVEREENIVYSVLLFRRAAAIRSRSP